MIRGKLGLVFLLGLLIPMFAFGQEAAEKKNWVVTPGPIYVDAQGQIFVKSGTALYLRLATSPDDKASSYIMKNEISKDPRKQPEAFYLEGHGRHTIRHEADHRVPQKSKERHLFYVHDDGKSPRSKVSVTKAPWVYNGNTNIYGKPVDITIDFADADSGVFSGYVALNSDSFIPYISPIPLTEEKKFKLEYFALDNVGNKSRTRTRYYDLDFTAPETTHRVIGNYVKVGEEEIVSPRSRIGLKSKDLKAGVKEIRYRFKGKRGIYDNKLLTMEGLKDGIHELVYAAEDRVKNAEQNHTFSFYLDSIPPENGDRLLGDQYLDGTTQYVSGGTVVMLTASDEKAGLRRIRYAINSGRKETYEYPFSFPKKNGKAVYEYRASDLVRNVSERVVKSVIVDISAPKVVTVYDGEHYFSRNTHYIRKTTKMALSTSDNLSGVKSFSYAVDADPENSDGKPFTIEEEGIHTLKINAVDNVNNVTPNNFLNMYVDEKAPEIYHHFGVNETVEGAQVYPLKTLVYLAATDKQAGIRNIYYSINGGKEMLYRKPLSFKTKQDYSVSIRAIDNVGNISTSDINFTIQ